MVWTCGRSAVVLAAMALLGSCGQAPDAALIEGGVPGGSQPAQPPFKIDRVVFVKPQADKPGCLRFTVTRNLPAEIPVQRLALNYVAFTDPIPPLDPSQGLLPGFYGDKLSCKEGIPAASCTARNYVAVANVRRLCVDRNPRKPDGEMVCGSDITDNVQVQAVIDWTEKKGSTLQPAQQAQVVRKVYPPANDTERSCSDAPQ